MYIGLKGKMNTYKEITMDINFTNLDDINRKIWIEKRTKALKIVNENLNQTQDFLTQSALFYLIQLLKLDGDNEYLLEKGE
jgi:hypothetical protein